MDGTLIDSEPVWVKAIETCCAKAGITVTPVLLAACAGLATADGIRLVLQHHSGHRGVDPEILGAAIKDQVWECLRRQPPVMSGADALLRELHRRGVPMALVSSSPRQLIQSVLDGLAWPPFFQFSLSTEEVGPSKPDPAVYVEAIRRLGASPAEGLAVEDTLAGLRAARGAGLFVVAIPSYPHEVGALRQAADAAFTSLAEATPWVLARFPAHHSDLDSNR
jgi:HAD superfamily hydrolase (TIGR01509 family)